MKDICAKCNKPPVAGCDGRGYTRVDDMTVQTCTNIYRRQLAQHLGPEIAGVVHTKSPLLKLRPGGGEPLVDLTKRNLLIKCHWMGFLPHLKWVLGFKGVLYSHHIITDERIKNVFVGSEAYKARPASTRDQVATFNSVNDLVSLDYDLVVVKLGYLGYKNQAAAGALKETLLYRASINRPLWLLEDPDRNWTHSHDPDVAQYVDEQFATVELKSKSTGTPKPVEVEEVPGMSESEEEPPTDIEHFIVSEDDLPSRQDSEPEAEETAHEEPDEADTSELSNDIPMLGANQPDRKSWQRRGR